jgi:hypothetical protein
VEHPSPPSTPSTQPTLPIPAIRSSEPARAEANPQGPAAPEPARREGRNPWAGVARTAIVGGVVVAVLLGGLLILLAALGDALGSLNPFRDGVIESRTIDRSGPAVVKSITELGELTSASGYYEVVVDVERDVRPLPSFLAGERTLFVAAGSVDAVVDLAGLDASDIEVSDDRTSAVVTVPAPRVGDPDLDLQRSKVWGRERGLWDRLGDALGDGSDEGDPAGMQEVYRLGERRLGEAAHATPELSDKAKASATATLTGLLHGLGFTDVTVVFEEPDDR